MKDENKKIARLIKQIQRGNKSAFEEFYKLTSPKAYFIALKITQNEHDAEDILQESYIKVLEKINEIDTSQNVNSWLLRIVANKSKDLLKSRNHVVFENEEEAFFDDIPEEKAEFCPEENLDQEELRLEVMTAIDELTDEKRACIMMMYFGDMSVKEISESIEVPESTVKNRLYTARKDLKARFEKNGNILYGAALGGVLIWALSKTGKTTASAFAASTSSGAVLAGINSSAVTTAAVTTPAAATGTGIAAKVAALSVAQKVVAGVAATAVIGGSTAGVATVAKKIVSSNKTTTYTEEVTTAPSQTEEYAFAVIPTEESTTLPLSTTKITVPTATVRGESTTKRTSATSTTKTTAGISTTKQTTKKETTTKRLTATKPIPTTTTKHTTTATRPTTTTEPTTEEETTTRPTTTQPTTTKPTTIKPTTTEPTTQAPATVNVEVIDMNEEVVATFSFTVEADTEMTWEYLVSQIKNKSYEPKAGIYGDAVGAVAESGRSYSITAEL